MAKIQITRDQSNSRCPYYVYVSKQYRVDNRFLLSIFDESFYHLI